MIRTKQPSWFGGDPHGLRSENFGQPHVLMYVIESYACVAVNLVTRNKVNWTQTCIFLAEELWFMKAISNACQLPSLKPNNPPENRSLAFK